tara:strand:- start:390 stop:857 length:468 start_codon:yes stop_codon:yes gene_type:complete
MSLNYNLGKIVDRDTICWEDVPDDYSRGMMDMIRVDEDTGQQQRMSPITSAIIFGTMTIGLNAVTEKNFDDFHDRMIIVQTVYDTVMIMERSGPDDPFVKRPISYTELRQHIGLTTNATSMTKREFKEQIMKNLYRDATRERHIAESKIAEADNA